MPRQAGKPYYSSSTHLFHPQGLLNASKKLADLDPLEFDAIFLPGGHGVVFDLPDNEELAAALSKLYKCVGWHWLYSPAAGCARVHVNTRVPVWVHVVALKRMWVRHAATCSGRTMKN